MKKILFSVFTLLSTTLLSAQNIAYWDFNSVPSDNNTTTGTLTPKEGSGTITVVGGVTNTYSSGYSWDPEHVVGDNSGLQTTTYAAASSGNKTRGIQFNVDLTGKDKIGVEFWQRLSNTAANTWTFQYCLDVTAGSPVWIDYVTFGPVNAGDTWWFRQVDLSSVTDLNNNANAGFRVVATFDPVLVTSYKAANPSSSYSTSGTSRFDLLKVVSIVNYTVAFQKNEQRVFENGSGTAVVNALITSKGNFTSKIDLQVTSTATATLTSDYSIANSTFNINSFKNAGDTIPISISIINDALKESDEYLTIRFDNASYVNFNSNARHILYIKDDDKDIPQPNNALSLNLLSSYNNGSGSAEISAYDKASKRIFIANSVGNRLDIVNFSNPENPTLITSIPLGANNINSVACKDGIVALAIENGSDPQANGFVYFYDVDGNFLKSVEVGAMPDMITFNHAGTKVYTANEGEPNNSYTNDPEGSVSVIDISVGLNSLSQSNVKQISFSKYNGQETTLRASGIRIYGPGANAAKDFEPEYITISDNDSIAWVTLQENNALAKISLLGDSVISIMPLGLKDHSQQRNSMDASNVTGNIYSSTFPLKGMYMPDAIAHYSVGNNVYILTANEGDARAYAGYSEEARLSSTSVALESTVFPNSVDLKNNFLTGRINISTATGDLENDGDLDEIHIYGTRSFSIWDGETGAQVYDSGNEFELITESNPIAAPYFNATHSTSSSIKDRSDDKGPEPEGIVTAKINGKDYAFISFERIGGVIAYDITNPNNPQYVSYNNNRPTDRGAEGLIYIEPQDSPNGQGILILSNEVSSTLSIYSVIPCTAMGIANATAINAQFCEGQSAKLYASSPNSTYTYKWLLNNQPIAGANDSVLIVNQSGNYRLFAHNSTGCVDTSSVIVTTKKLHTSSTQTEVACDAYYWPLNNALYTQSTSVTHTITNAAGCDSVITLDLTINNSETGVANITACDSFTWVDGNTYTSNNNTATFTYQNRNFCDSVVTLNLIINHSDASTDNITACDSYTWIDGNTYTTSTSGVTYTTTNLSGCDSIITLNLTINNSDATTDNVTACNSYTWIDGNTYTTSTSGVTYTTTNLLGCDSIITLNLTINNSDATTDNVTACDSYTWIDGNTYTTSTSGVTYTATNLLGCDSIITLNLTINQSVNIDFSLQSNICNNANELILEATPAGGVFSGQGVINDTFNPQQVTPGTTITISYEYVSAEGCTSVVSRDITVDICTDFKIAQGFKLIVAPNPANDKLTINSSNSKVQELEISNVIGQVVYKSILDRSTTIDISHFTPGIYLVKVDNTLVKILKQ